MQMSTTDGGAHDIRNGNDAEIRPLSGINLAETLGINQILIGHARDMMRLMRKDSEQEEERMQSLKRAAEKRRIIFRVALQTAKLVREGNLDRNELLAIKEGLMDSLDELDMKNPLQIHIQR